MDAVRFVGIDPSLSGCGIVIINESGEVVEATELKAGKEDDPLRFMILVKRVLKHVDISQDRILIEGFSFGSKGRAVSTMYGLGWCFRIAFTELQAKWQEVPPTSLKKFASNKGNAAKPVVMQMVKKKWGFDHPSDNVNDAYVLAKMAWAMYNHDKLREYEKEVLKKIKKV